MRRIALALLFVLAPVEASAASLEVSLDQAVRISLKTPSADVIVGNPAIADVTVADQRHLVIIGKSYGVTNLVVVGASGRTIFDRQIVVGAPSQGRVSIFRGPVASSYACSPSCELSTGAGASASAPAAPAAPASPSN